MSALLALLPPITSGPVEWPGGPEPVYTTLRYWRTKNPRNGRSCYWHIPKSAHTSGHRLKDGPRVFAQLWCGQGRSITQAELSGDGDPVCATCMGRAIGSGQFDNPLPENLIFTPRWFLPPEQCPSKYAYVREPGMRPNRVRCLVCHSVERWAGGSRGGYGWTTPYIAAHDWPGPAHVNVKPCDFHGWTKLAAQDGGVVCGGCGNYDRHRPLTVRTYADVT